jgi:catechol 2,3-dioxygenase-like lactoylglutathione lyase family enzyme
MEPIGSLSGIILECRDPEALAGFYTALTGWSEVYADEDYRAVGECVDAAFHLSFQRAPKHEPPSWPDPHSSMQFHLHVKVPDLDEAERRVLELGGAKFPHQPAPDRHRVFADPAGHPFCLVPAR